MLSRWLWWAPLGAFILFWAIVGLRYGLLAATTTETDVINKFAAKYLQDHGRDAVLSDCAATPQADMLGVWMLISCRPRGTLGSYDYYVNRLGGLEFFDTPASLNRQGPRA